MMKTAIHMMFLAMVLTLAGCNYAFPPAIRNGTDAPIQIQCVLSGAREHTLALTPGNAFWTSKDRDTQVLNLIVDGRKYDLSTVADQYRNKIVFLVRKDAVVILKMADLPKRWYELTSDELAGYGKAVLKPK